MNYFMKTPKCFYLWWVQCVVEAKSLKFHRVVLGVLLLLPRSSLFKARIVQDGFDFAKGVHFLHVTAGFEQVGDNDFLEGFRLRLKGWRQRLRVQLGLLVVVLEYCGAYIQVFVSFEHFLPRVRVALRNVVQPRNILAAIRVFNHHWKCSSLEKLFCYRKTT